MEKKMFKVGDEVYCINNTDAPTDLKVGQVYKITQLDPDQYGNQRLVFNNQICGWYANRFRKVCG